MPKVIYSMSVSLDGFIAGPGGEIDWGAPDDELHRFHNERVREIGTQLMGRRLYEEMLFWERPPDSLPPTQAEFARIWQALPRVVFSRTLDRVEGNAQLATGAPAEELDRLREQGGGDVAVGGAGLAATFARLGLIDEYQLFVNPVVLGGGTPLFPPLDARIELEFVETRTFASRVVYLRDRRAESAAPSGR
jgi:dihydrofolate reductase